MANRFLEPVQSEYVPQYTPDIIDPQTAIEAAKNKQGRYDLALSAASNDFINPEYVALGENNEIAQQKIKEYSDWQKSIMSDLTNDKDVSKAARSIIEMNQAYNSDPDLERLKTNSAFYKEQVGNILKGKNANSNATLLKHYQNQFSNTIFKDELGQYGEVPSAVAGDPLDYNTFVPHIKSLVAKQGIPIKEGVKAFYNEQGQLIAYNIQTGKEVKVDGELVKKAVKQFIQSNPMYQAALPTHHILFGEEGNETMLDMFIDGVGDMMNQSDTTYKDNIIQVKAGEESTRYSPPQAALDALSYRNVQVPTIIAENSGTTNSEDLETGLTTQQISLMADPKIAESAATLAEAFQSLGEEVADPRYNGTNQPMAFEPVKYDLQEAINSGTNFEQAFIEQGTLQTMNDDLFLTGEELEAIKNPTLKAKAYKANQLLLRKNSEVILFNERKKKQNELLYKGLNGPLSESEIISTNKLNISLQEGDMETALDIIKEHTTISDEELEELRTLNETLIPSYNKGIKSKGQSAHGFWSGVLSASTEGDNIEITPKSYVKDYSTNLPEEVFTRSGLSKSNFLQFSVHYETFKKENRDLEQSNPEFAKQFDAYLKEQQIGTGVFGDSKDIEIFRKNASQLIDYIDNSPEINTAKRHEADKFLKGRIQYLFENDKEGSFGRRWAVGQKRYNDNVKTEFTNKLSNVMFRDYSDMKGTTDQKNAWVTTGASTIHSYADGLTKRLEDPGKVMNFLAGGRVYDMATGEDVTMSIQLEEGLRSLVTRDYNDKSKNTADGSYAIGDYNFSYGGISNIPDIGNAVMLNVTRKVGENEKASTESYNLLVTGPEVDQMANFQQVEKYRLMTNTDQGAKYNSEAVGEYNDILNDLTNLMNQTSTNSISKYPAGIAEVKLEDETGRITYGKKQILVDIIPKPDGLNFILHSYYLDNTGNKMTYGNIISSDNLSLSDIAADIAAQYIQIK